MPNTLGAFVWYDLMTTDPEAAQAFYSEVIGWSTVPFEGMDDYTMWAVDENPLGGVGTLPDEAKEMGAPPHWLAYVSTPDVDDTAKKAESLGGTLLKEPTDIPEVGRFAVIQDPQGAVLAIYTSASTGDEDWEMPSGQPGAFVWHELMTTDVDAAWDFYGELFSWEKTDAMEMETFTYQMYGQGDETYGGIGLKPEEAPAPYWMYYIEVDDLEAAIDRTESHGGEVAHGPMEVPGGSQIVHCLDPQGAMFAMHETAK